MASPNRQRASSTTPPLRPWDYEVFLSFRGPDSRRTFTSHLYEALVKKGIVTFMDDEGLKRGEDIGTALFKVIENSRCALVILSQNYADSRWCLQELAKIMQCRLEMGLIVFPVFYHLDPSDVRNQRGSYGYALEKHARIRSQPETQRWRAALKEVGSLAGWPIHDQPESQVIQHIVDTILVRIRTSQNLLHVDKNLIGMDDRSEKLIPKIIDPSSNDVRMIGVYGLRGIGKTTISKVVYNRIASQFMIASFIANVREESKSRGLPRLQKQLLRDILPGKKNFITSIDEGAQMIKERLRFKKVFLVLDDVDSLDQLEALAGDRNWFGPGSIIIVTTTDRRLLEMHKMNEFYEAKKLDHEEAVELFSRHAFEQKYPKEGYETLSDAVVLYVDGLPLGLKVLGRFLSGKTIIQWESELQKLEREPNQEIQSVLKRSYDELDRTQKEIFLDVACFFNGEDADRVTRILNACNFYADSGIQVLSDKCLITIFDNMMWMHDLLQQMGRDIVRQECPRDPEKCSRLCYPEDVNRVLTRKLGTAAIEGILFDVSIPKRIHITTKSFEMMNKLRLLKIYWAQESASMGGDSKLKLPIDFEFPSYELKYLHWHGYPLEYLPSSFDAEDLVEVDMSYSRLKQLWESNLLFQKLNTIRFSFSQHLMVLPDFSESAPNLEKLIFDGCSSLVEVHPSIGRLNKIILLNLKNCKALRSFPSIIDMKALEILNLSGCSELQEFPDIQGNMEYLVELHLASTAIKEVPSAIRRISGLLLLDLRRCKNLSSLPASIFKLKSLEYLFLSGCSSLENFPELMEDMENLKELLLDGTSIEVLPSSIERLKGLLLLNMRKCKNLVSLPNSICNLRSLQTLILSGCTQLHQLPKNIGSLQRLVQLHADGTSITQPPDSIVLLKNLRVLIYPGCKILPSSLLNSLFSFWLLHRNSSDGIGLQLPSVPSLSSFTNLNLSSCNLMEGVIPDDICFLYSLKKLDLRGNKFLSTPTSLSELTNLRDLWLGQCQNLIEIPGLPPNVREIDAHGCTSLLLSSASISMLQWLQFLFYYCLKPVLNRSSRDKRDKIVSFSGSEPSLTNMAVVSQKIFENVAFSMILPGNEIPKWIWNQNMGSIVRIKLPTDWYDDEFLGFAVCSVVEHLPDKIICHLSSDALEYGDLRGFGHDFHSNDSNVSLEHVWLAYQPCAQLRTFQMNDPNEWSYFEISFEATSRVGSSASNLVKKCGVRLIYAEDLESIQCSLGDDSSGVGGNMVDRAGSSGSRNGSVSNSQQSMDGFDMKLKGKYFPE